MIHSLLRACLSVSLSVRVSDGCSVSLYAFLSVGPSHCAE